MLGRKIKMDKELESNGTEWSRKASWERGILVATQIKRGSEPHKYLGEECSR